MLEVLIQDEGAYIVLPNVIVYHDKWTKVPDKFEKFFMKKINQGRDIILRKDGKILKTEIVVDQEQEEDKIVIPFDKLFEPHIIEERINKIKEYTKDVDVLEKIIDWAKKNQTEKVVRFLEIYRDEILAEKE